MFLRMKRLPGVDNLRNYPAEIVKELEELLRWGGSALPAPKRKSFFNIENNEGTFFLQISSITVKVVVVAAWRKAQLWRLDAGSYELDGRVRLRAYQLYEQRGKRNGHASDDWLEAEAELTKPRALRAVG